MNPVDGRRFGLREGGRRHALTAIAAVAAVAALAAVVAACGGSSGSQGTAGQLGQVAPTAMQVLTKVERGDITETVTAPVKVKSLAGTAVVVATVPAENAAAVAKGQTATVMLIGQGMPQPGASGVPVPQGSGMPQPGASGMPQGAPSGMPVPQGSGMPQPGASGMPQPGQGGDMAGGDFAGRGTAGTVTAVVANADGTATATIRLDETPADAAADSAGFAAIQVKVLASDVLVIPTAAIKVSGDSATVQVIANGTTETRDVQVGQQSGSQTEIVSGLTEGENVVWERSFPGFSTGQSQTGETAGQTEGGTQ